MSFSHGSDIDLENNKVLVNTAVTAKDFITYSLRIGALKLLPEGRRLKSGRISPYFFNSGLYDDGASLTELIKAYVDTAFRVDEGANFDVVYGPAYKGITLASGMAQMFYSNYNLRVGYAFNRKEEKDHGEGGSLIGVSLGNKRVLIVDDVMTTGTSSGEAVEIVRANGGIPVGCIIAFDRQEVGIETSQSAVQEFQLKYEVPVVAVATLSDLIDLLKVAPIENGDDEAGEILDKILAYQKQYGV